MTSARAEGTSATLLTISTDAYADGAMNVRGVITALQFCDKEAYRDEDT